MPGFPYGMNRAIKIVVSGFVLALVIRVLLVAFDMSEFVIIFNVLSILLIVLLYHNVKYWSLSYCCGWFIGFMFFAILLTPIEIVIYAVVFIPLFILKISRKLG